MSIIRQQAGHRRKPRFARLNPLLKKDIISYYTLAERSGRVVKNIADTRESITLINTPWSADRTAVQPEIATGYFKYNDVLSIAGGTDFTFVCRLRPDSWEPSFPGVWRSGVDCRGRNYLIFDQATGRPYVKLDNITILRPGAVGYAVPLGSYIDLALRIRSGIDVSFFVDGKLRHYATHSVVTPQIDIYRFGYQYNISEKVAGPYESFGFFNRALSDKELLSFSEKRGAIYAPRTRTTFVADASGSNVPLTGATVSLATTSGTITTSIPITGTAANIANANGALSAAISLSGAAVAEAIATAALASGSPLSGDAISAAIASGGVTVNFNLDGNAVAKASAAADLAQGGRVPLSGSASASADAGVAPTMDVPISGASISNSGASGSPGVIFPVSGAAASVTTVVGSLNIGIGIAANASAELLADGVITFKVNLDSAAVAQASAAGALSLGGQHRLPPSDRLNVVAFERRIERVKLVSF